MTMIDSNGPNWDPVTWEQIRQAIREEVERASPAHQLLPNEPIDPSATIATVDRFDVRSGRVAQDVTVPVVELVTTFSLSDEQVQREDTRGEARAGAVARARSLTHATSLVLLQGESTVPSAERPGGGSSAIARSGPSWEGIHRDWHGVDLLSDERQLATVVERLRYITLRTGLSEDDVTSRLGRNVQNVIAFLFANDAIDVLDSAAVGTMFGDIATVLQAMSVVAAQTVTAQEAALARRNITPAARAAAQSALALAAQRGAIIDEALRQLRDELRPLYDNLASIRTSRAAVPVFSTVTQALRGTWPEGVSVANGTKYAGLVQYARDFRVVPVSPVYPGQPTVGASRYHLNLVASVNQAIDALREKDHFGPYVLLLHPSTYADAHTPLEDSRIRPVDMLAPDIEHLTSSRALHQSQGLVISVGGNGLDVVVPEQDVEFAFVRVDSENRFVFRMRYRLALRVKREGVAVALEFLDL